jgi:cephalosporin hydroxylase
MNSRAFDRRNREKIEQMQKSDKAKKLSMNWFSHVSKYEYSYHFTWLGRPIIQFPQDVIAMQEIIWTVKPDLIIESGIAHGGFLVFYASMLELIGGDGLALGIDVEVRPHNRVEIEQHPLWKRMAIIEGSSVDNDVVRQVMKFAEGKRQVLVALDSNHTHEHVRKELELYSPLVKKGGYLVVFDTIIEDMPDDFSRDRCWGRGNNPKTAVMEFLKSNDRFVVDKEVEDKLLITVAPGGYLKCVKD